MPIFCESILTLGSGRSAMFSPLSILSIDTAASWPWATAQMMFLGPKAASPPKYTFLSVDCMVTLSTTGMPHLSNSMPMSFSIQGNAFSWPTAISTSSHGTSSSGSPVGTSDRCPLSSYTALTFSKVMPVSLPPLCSKVLGTMKLRIGMPSCIASSFSHGEAFISSKPERTMTLTSSPPRRREERQQSIAVLPPPSTITRRPIFSIWPNETEDSQSMPMWMFFAASLRPGMSRLRPRGAPVPTNTASYPSARTFLSESTVWPPRSSTPMSRM